MANVYRTKAYTHRVRSDVQKRDDKYYAQSAALLDNALRHQDIAAFLDALNVLVKAEGYAAVAQKTGLNRTALYKAMSPLGSPRIHTIVALLSALDLRLCVAEAALSTPKRMDTTSGSGHPTAHKCWTAP